MAHEALNDFNKKRKPYTITKPRENWSKEEHSRFLEALKLYERDWKQIGAYVKSKTVIQIRSHAQKYFLKMEKMGRTDCIPPPRAKKRSKRPYPRSRPGRVAGGYDEETEYFIWEPGMDAEGREPAKPPAWDLKWQLMHRANLADLGPAVLDAVRHHLQQALATHVPTKTPAQPLEQQFHNNAESFSKHENGQIRADDVAPEHEKAYAFLCNLLDPNASGHAEELEKMSERDRNVVQSLLHALEGLPENPNANACNEDSNPPPPSAIYQAPTQSEFNQPANQFAFAHANGEYAPAFHHQPAQHTAQPYSSFPQQRAATQLAPSFGMKREEGLFRQPQQQPWLSPQAGFPELYDNHHHHQQHPFGLPQDPSPQRLMLPPQPQGGEGHFDHNNQHHHNNSDHYPYETSDPSKTPVGYGIPFIRTPDPHEFQPSASPLHFDSAWFSPARRHGAYDPFYTTSGFASFQTPPALIPGPSEYSSLYSADYPPQSHTPVHEIQYGGEYALQSQTPQPQELYAQAQQHAEQSHHGEFGQQQQPAVPMHTNGDNNNDMQFEYPEDRPGFHQHQLQQHQNQQQQQGFGFGFSQQQNHHNGQSQQAHVPMSRSPEPQLIRPVPIRASPPPSPQVHAQNALQALLLCNEQPLDGPAS